MTLVLTGLGAHLTAVEGPIDTPPACRPTGPIDTPTGPPDPRPFLRSPKSSKFMGLQDELAVVAAGRALADAGLSGFSLGPRAGVFLVVGHIPFDRADVDALLDASVTEDGAALDMARFSTAGMEAVSPLLTFRCLPNMPAYHVSANFDVQGPGVVGYPGVEQGYALLDEALSSLREGEVDVALVGGVAHQRNFLVEAHFARLSVTGRETLSDAAALFVLETEVHAKARGAAVRGRLESFRRERVPVSPFDSTASRSTHAQAEHAAALPLALFRARAAGATGLVHAVTTADGFHARSRWSLTP